MCQILFEKFNSIFQEFKISSGICIFPYPTPISTSGFIVPWKSLPPETNKLRSLQRFNNLLCCSSVNVV